MSCPLSVQPQSGVSHVIADDGGLATRFVTSVSNTHPPPLSASACPESTPPDELPLLEELPLPLEELPPSPPLEEPELLEESSDIAESSPDVPSIPPSLGPAELSPPQPPAQRETVTAQAARVAAPRVKALMCRSRSRPASAS